MPLLSGPEQPVRPLKGMYAASVLWVEIPWDETQLWLRLSVRPCGGGIFKFISPAGGPS